MTKNIPTILVIFGVGDLMKKKVAPALFHLFEKGRLPQMFKIIGFAREEFSGEEFGKYIFESLTSHRDINIKTCGLFCQLFSFQHGFFHNLKDYKNLEGSLRAIDDKWGICSNKLFYLAVPPEFYKTIFKNLANSGLTRPCSPEEGWTRVLVEKPFGKDLKTAQELERLLSKLFKEIQIYRIDHYLAKEMLQNILVFRFSNNLFENNWSNKFIEQIEIRLLEKIGVEDRGSFYDGLGALRDVGQNHLLQMLALITMDNPVEFRDETIRKKRAEILKTLIPPSKKEIQQFTFRAQYSGYREIKGVRPDSNTETYFKVRGFLSSPRWQGVPIIMESGKRISEHRKEIIVTLKHPIPCLCRPGLEEHHQNKLIFSLEPLEGVTFELWRKKPGLTFGIEKEGCLCPFREQEKRVQYVEEYERLLYDCIVGDQTLFVSSKEVEAMWRFVDPIITAWQKGLVSLNTYQPDTQPEVEWLEPAQKLKKELAIVGLGKMGKNMMLRLQERGWKVLGFDKDSKELVKTLTPPRIVWLMVPAPAVDEVIAGLVHFLDKNDIIIDGGNSFYKDSIRRASELKKRGIIFVDVGVSGGPAGARYGACLMVGGQRENYEYLLPLFSDLTVSGGLQFFEGVGAGHFVKMIHNGVEYGMMQAIAEGFTILKKSKYRLDLKKVADVYNHGSVIESRLVSWLKEAFEFYGQDLKKVSGKVGHTGEGEWTVKTAKEMQIKAKIIEGALEFRKQSAKNPSYTGKVLTALRNRFGGHPIQ